MSTTIKSINQGTDLGNEQGKIVVVGGQGLSDQILGILETLDTRLLAVITTSKEIDAILKKVGDRNCFLINAASLKEGLRFGKYVAGDSNSVCFLSPHYFSDEENQQDIEQIISECNSE